MDNYLALLAAMDRLKAYDAQRILECTKASYKEKWEQNDPLLFVEDIFEEEEFEEAFSAAEAFLANETPELFAFLRSAWRRHIDFDIRRGPYSDNPNDFELHYGRCVCYELFYWIAERGVRSGALQ